MEKIRTFIAIDLSTDIKKEFAGLIEQLKKSGADVKWVKAENIHLTLKFLGHISAEKIEQVKKALDNAKSKFRPFSLRLSGIGAFPKLSYPRVIWAGMEEGKNNLQRIYGFLETELEKIGFQKEQRPFSAHLTLGRVKSSKNKETLKSIIESSKFVSGQALLVNRVILFQSTLTPQGPVYTRLYEACLGG